jgi:hypothetical protein
MLKPSGKIVVKYSRFVFGFMVVLGIVFLAIIPASLYLYYSDAISVLASLGSSQYVIWFVLAGIVIITVGTVGLGRQNFKNHRSLLTLLMVVLVPLLTYANVLFAASLMIVHAPMFPMRSEITEIIVVDSNPLVLSLSVKAITRRDSRIDSAIIKNSNETMVA